MRTPRLWFVVPSHGRLALTAICLRQLRRTCDTLTANNVEASAVIVADDENLDTARGLGFATIERDNTFTSRRFNDGIQLACDPGYNRRPVDYVVPCGSDDWVHWRLFTELPRHNTIHAFQRMAFVREDGRELTVRHLNNEGGCGIRIYPAAMMQRSGCRPADEDRERACDTSILRNLIIDRSLIHGHIVHRDADPLWIVDWKTKNGNLNTYRNIAKRHRSEITANPFDALSGVYPAASLREMRAHYQRRRTLVAA